MIHTRPRELNTRDIHPEKKLDDDLGHAVVARDMMVFVRTQVGQSLDTAENVGRGGRAEQTEILMATLKTLLEEASSELSHVCKITICIVDLRYREAVYRVIGKWLKRLHPVSTDTVVYALGRLE
jgi:enamine deaminase RidA (YjgF/YER057c/UK114 family)